MNYLFENLEVKYIQIKYHYIILNKSGSAMRTYVDFHLFLIMNDGMSQCTVSVRPQSRLLLVSSLAVVRGALALRAL